MQMHGWTSGVAPLLWPPCSTKRVEHGGVLTTMWLQGVPILWSLAGSTKAAQKNGQEKGLQTWVLMHGWASGVAPLHLALSNTECVELGGVLTTMWLQGVPILWPLEGSTKNNTPKWPGKGGANMGADAWVGLRCCSPNFATLKYTVRRAWRCAHHHVAPRGAHVMGLRKHSSFRGRLLEFQCLADFE